MTPATHPDPRLCGFTRQPLDVDTLNARRLWQAASGHPGGWRVVREWPSYPDLEPPMQELEGASGRRILFRSLDAAKRPADTLNAAEV